jgi:acyl carrier protein
MTENEQKLISIFHEISGVRDQLTIGLDSKINDLELDSLDVLDVIMRIQKELNFDVPILNFSLCKDLRDVYQEVSNANQ